MKLRILTVAAAGVFALSLAACQKKAEEAPAADASATAPATEPAAPATPPADATATTPPAGETTTTPPADTGAMQSTTPPAMPEKK